MSFFALTKEITPQSAAISASGSDISQVDFDDFDVNLPESDVPIFEFLSKKKWIDNLLYPDLKSLSILDDEGVITRQESDLRIIIGSIFIAILLLIPTHALLSQNSDILTREKSQKLQSNDTKLINVFERPFPLRHFAAIFDDGSVYALSLSDRKAPEFLLKLPKWNTQVHGFSDENGMLYFMEASLSKPIRQYHVSFGAKRAKKIAQFGAKKICNYFLNSANSCKDSGPFPSEVFSRSLVYGKDLWLYWNQVQFAQFGGGGSVHANTVMWNAKKHRLLPGPEKPFVISNFKFVSLKNIDRVEKLIFC